MQCVVEPDSLPRLKTTIYSDDEGDAGCRMPRSITDIPGMKRLHNISEEPVWLSASYAVLLAFSCSSLMCMRPIWAPVI